MSKTWLSLLYFKIIITMCMKDGMSDSRLDDAIKRKNGLNK